MSVKITGLRELLSNLSAKEKDIITAARKANLAGGRVIADNLRKNVARSGYSGPNPQPTLLSSIVMSGNRSNTSTFESYVAVGFNRSANFRAHFPEFGSISQSPQGYMAKTVHQSESSLAVEMAKAIRGAIG